MYAPEHYPLQGGQVQPNAPPAQAQHTTVNVNMNQDTRLTEIPRDHLIWSLFNFLYCNPFCLGLVALIYSVKARDKKVMRDIEGARAHESTARNLNIASTVIICLTVLITIITFSVIPNMYYSDGEGAVMVRQHTTVNVVREMPKDHVIWSLCCFLYFNPCCLGLAALICSVKARDRKLLGDIEAARQRGSTAQTLNIISTVLFCIVILIIVIVVSVLFTQLAQAVHVINGGSSYDGYGRGGYSG